MQTKEDIQRQIYNLTMRLKMMSISDSSYAETWDKRVDLKSELHKVEKRISNHLARKIYEVAKEKGIKLPKSECVWEFPGVDSLRPKGSEYDSRLEYSEDADSNDTMIYPAYDSSELEKELPSWIQQVKRGSTWQISFVIGSELYTLSKNHSVFSSSEIEARGKMYLYLLQNDLLNYPQV